jgi:4,5:9,10-diseco-3-hydroxy-5,9,17-trioxoandrosta-1(10),2-diene-4-oate hydrolase
MDLLDFDETGHTLDSEKYRLHYHEAGDGPVLILLHGSGPGVSGWSNFRGNFPVFAKQFRTIILDMPGMGLSTLAEVDRAYPKIGADGLRTLMDALDVPKAHLLGNSMGGAVTMQFALDNPDRCERLVMMGPGGVNTLGPATSEGGTRLMEFLENPTREGMLAWVHCMVANKSVITDELIDERMKNALMPGVIEMARAIRASNNDKRFFDEVPNWARLHKIKNPVLITWGRDDRMTPLDMGLFPFRRLPNAEMHIFSNCGHWAQVERKSDFERLVIDFLTRD